jgi:hypothetical protein
MAACGTCDGDLSEIVSRYTSQLLLKRGLGFQGHFLIHTAPDFSGHATRTSCLIFHERKGG